MQFEWDNEKVASNFRKHGVSFAEAKAVFGDSLARIFDDDEHSNEEKRNGIFGRLMQSRLLLISFTERDDDTIRIISAREATPKERRKYANENG